MLPDEFRRFGQSIVAVATFSSNIYFWLTTGYFAPDAENQILLHTWSLAVEEQFYVIFPLLLWVFCRMRFRMAFWSTLAVTVASFLLCEWGWRYSATFNFYSLPTRAWQLLAGSLIAFGPYIRMPQWLTRKELRMFLPAVGLTAIVVSMLAFDSETPFPSYYAAMPVLGTALIIQFLVGSDTVGRLLSTSPFVFIGLISYSAYLWHRL